MIRIIIRLILELLWWDWQHVGLFEIEFSFDYNNWKIYIHCYESRWGSRRIKIRGSYITTTKIYLLTSTARRGTKATKLYQTELLPWLHGRAHGKIPSYQKVKGGKWDFLKKLKGEPAVILNDEEK